MPVGTAFKITGNWKRLQHIVSKDRFERALKVDVRKATTQAAMIVVKEIKKRISGRSYSPNAQLTILIKKSTLPLVDDSDLYNSITHMTVDEKSAFVGVLRKVEIDGRPAADLALMLHEGASITVTNAMRGLFFALASVGEGRMQASELTGRAAELATQLGSRIKKIRPLKASTSVIVIPPRPFLKVPFEDRALLGRIKQIWERAVDASIRGAPPGVS